MIGIVCFNSLRYYQFLYKYTRILDKNNIKYEVIFWNRENEQLEIDKNWISFNYSLNTFQPFYKKVKGFIKYKIFLKKLLKERKYKKIIVLTSQTAFVLFKQLITQYSNKYIFDFRDITFENIYLYKVLINRIIKNSIFTSISSEGFINKLGYNNKYVLSHNTRNFELLNIKKNYASKIRVVYWGMVRQLDFNYKICDLFSKDERFELYYHGAGYHNELKKYCEENDYKNIFITGAYKLDKISDFAQNTDIVLNLYNNDIHQQPAMTVKFYDSIMYGRPMIVNKNSYMAELVKEYNLGFVLDINEDTFLEDLYKNFLEYNFDKYEMGRLKIFKKIKDDDKKFEEILLKHLL